MLTLYHYWSSVCSQKARFCLAEKGLEWQSRHIDLFTFDHWQPDYLALNPKAVVPTLDHDGHVLIESNVIAEYLDDAFSGPALIPTDALAKARMRLWLYDSEAIAHPGVNTASYNPRHAPRLARFSKEQLMETVSGHPDRNTRIRMMKRAEHGVPAEEEHTAYANLGDLLDRMEATLADGLWILGEAFSLADIAMAPYINRIEVLARPEMVAEAVRPRVAEWWQRVQGRPGFHEAFSFANPNADDPVKR
jgi:glutathione S-transferase